MNKQEAEILVLDACKNGTYPLRTKYRNNNGIGKIAEDLWNDPVFTYGIEYGLLIALYKFFKEE